MFVARMCGLSILLAGLTAAQAAPKSAAPPKPAPKRLPMPVEPLPAPVAFERMRKLVGNWAASLPDGKQYRVSFKLVAGDSVLVQTYTTPSGKETLTVYAVDGERLLATHYCAQGNQPRLALAGEAAGTLSFDFVDATNLRDPAKSHLRHLELALGKDELIETEVYRNAGTDEAESFVFKRVP